MKKMFNKRSVLNQSYRKYRICNGENESEGGNINNCDMCGEDDDNPFNFSESETVSNEGNRVYFYGEVEKPAVLSLNKAIYRISIALQNRANELETVPGNIFLHINSNGGDLFDGLIASDYVKKSKVPIHSIIDGVCASAATFISVVSAKRFIHENSFMLIHELSSQAWGSYSKFKDEMYNLDILMNTIKKIYREHTKIPSKKLEEILKKDIYLSSEEALKFGLVDCII